MKAIATTLLGLMFCASVWAQPTITTITTTRDIHDICEARARRETSDEALIQHAYDSGYLLGFVTGIAAATPTVLDLPETQGELKDAVCKYIDLHPEIWKLTQADGVNLALKALYGRKK